ncbi:MAG: tuaG [Chitinophagaceae bacterium]|nr:tuaG [Chitinophagaceae bacterium]
MVLFSIVIPTYNRAAFVKKAVDSVIAQTCSDWELIVVDDASTDHTMDVLNSYADPRIRIVRNTLNLERSASRNKGIEAARGEYICFLDSDDYYFPQHLEILRHEVELLNHPVALIHTNVSVRDISDHELRQINYSYSSIRSKTEWVLSNHIQPNAVAIHHSILNRFRFDTTLSINEDVYLFAQIAAAFPILHIPELTVAWVHHLSNTTKLIHDYISPQLLATRKIFNDSSILVPQSFKKNKYFELYSQLVYFYASNKKSILSGRYFIKAISVAPFNKGNWNNFLNVIYHLPGGKWLKKTMQLFNR